jgi:hypothetical protein
MGLDYTYRLFFPRERVPEALEGLAARCAPPRRETARICLPQGIREFPFEPFREDALPNWDDESYSFDIILRLEADEALEKFTRIAPQQLEAQGGETALGYVYFRVDNPPDEAVSLLRLHRRRESHELGVPGFALVAERLQRPDGGARRLVWPAG